MMDLCYLMYSVKWKLKTAVILIFILSGVNGILPEASQEGMLHPFKSYADITLFHYNVPPEVTRATWEFAAFMDNPKCMVKQVHIYIQHGSYPVMSPDNSSFPPEMYTGRTSLHYIVTDSAYQPHDATIFPVYNPLPGNWFVAAYISSWDKRVQQEGLGLKCHYSLGSVALWSQVVGIPIISPGAAKDVSTVDTISYYKIFIPSGTWHFTVKISDCKFHVHSLYSENETVFCIENMALRARALPTYNLKNSALSLLPGAEYTFTEYEPYTNGYYYLLVVSESRVNFTLYVKTTVCGVQTLGKNLAKQFFPMPESLAPVITVRHSNNTVKSDWANTILYANDSKIRRFRKLNNIFGDADYEDPCLPTFQLARIKHAQDFADSFLLQVHEWYTTWIALTDFLPVIVQLEILPFVDIGGTLSINIHLDEQLINSSQTLMVKACIRQGKAPSRSNQEIFCSPDLQLNVTSESLLTVDATKLIPYPEPDTWFIAFEAECSNGSVVPCVVEEMMISLDIRTQPCVFSSEPCGLKGICQETHKGLHFFTSCSCLGGYQGWGCTDGSHATSEWLLLLTTLLLTLSNVFFIPAIIVALRQGLLTEAIVYMATMIFSMFYHACDQDLYSYCITKYEVLQFCDFFCSILAFWVTLIAIAGIPRRFTSCLHMVGVLIIAVGVEYNRTGLLVFIIPFALGIIIPFVAWIVRSCRQKTCIKLYRSSIALLLPGILLAAVGLILFTFIETEANYQYVHSTWHVVIALSLVFLLPRKCEKSQSGTLQNPNEAELLDINDYYSASPVFVVTSDLDNLLNAQT